MRVVGLGVTTLGDGFASSPQEPSRITTTDSEYVTALLMTHTDDTVTCRKITEPLM